MHIAARTLNRLLLPLALLFLSTVAWAAPQQDPAAPAGITIENDVAVPMRDGVLLRADVWRPQREGRFPVLVYRTPYDRKRAPGYSIFQKAVERGYAVVIEDVRGRYGSDGEYDPYRHEGRDGYDTIEWAARQPWSNGAVGTFGLSYPGAVQWLAAVESPPSLKAMVPAMTFSSPRNFFYSGGVFDLSWINWIWNNIAPDLRVKKDLPGPRTGAAADEEWERRREEMLFHLPLSTLPDLKREAPFFYRWMEHPPQHSWWDWAEIRGKYDRTSAAVLNISGWHDEAYGPEGASTNFLGLRAARQARDARTHLVLGPWVHGVPTGRTRSGEREFGPAADLDYDELVLRWLDRYVRGLENGVDREPPVRVFVMGANRWRESDAWPLPGTRETAFYLQPAAQAGRGGLSQRPPQATDSFGSFVSDPANPVVDPYATRTGAHDYRELAQRQDLLVFETEPFAQGLEVVGAISAEIHLSVDAPDTDLWLKLMDVAPDGIAYNLMSPGLDVVRASYQHGPLRRGQVYRLRFDNLMTGNLFKPGHRLRLLVTTSFMPHFSRNLHTGKSETVSAEMRKATIRVYHDKERPSRLILPVIPPTQSR